MVAAADVGRRLRFSEVATNADGTSEPAYSQETAVISSNVPLLTGFSPSSGITGSVIEIEGAALSSTSQVVLGKLSAPFTVVSANLLEATVPNGAKSGKLLVTTAHGTVKSKAKYTVTLAVTSFKPTGGAAGTTVTIKGVGFNGSSSVMFDGVKAAVVSASAKAIKATVPAGAGAGQITVTNSTVPLGTVSSATSYKP